MPLYALARRWRALITSALLLLLLCLATFAVAGGQPFVTFAREMVPTFGRPNDTWNSITAHSFLSRLYGPDPIPREAEGVLRAVQVVLIALGAAGLLRNLRGLPEDPVRLLAASLAMVGGFLIFSPQAWGHYLVYLVPFWGYLVWEAEHSRGSRWVIAPALALLWAPREAIKQIDRLGFDALKMNAIAGSSELWAMLVVVIIAIARLHRPGRPMHAPQEGDSAPQGRPPGGPSPRGGGRKGPITPASSARSAHRPAPKSRSIAVGKAFGPSMASRRQAREIASGPLLHRGRDETAPPSP